MKNNNKDIENVLTKWLAYCVVDGNFDFKIYKTTNKIIEKYKIQIDDDDLINECIEDLQDDIIKLISLCPQIKIATIQEQIYKGGSYANK